MSNAKIFYPKDAGLTKDDVFEMIDERRQDGYPASYVELNEVQPDLLTDDLMQKFVDDYHNAQERNIEFGDEAVGRATEKVIFNLAKILTNSPKVKFDL